ncbi:hypothetical protein L0337_29255 [candidate division KSB1 bacterium]|nr:hypothetical protein [candidate division KSB1 bacterium]
MKAAWGAATYAASKFAVEGFSQAIAEELPPSNIANCFKRFRQLMFAVLLRWR